MMWETQNAKNLTISDPGVGEQYFALTPKNNNNNKNKKKNRQKNTPEHSLFNCFNKSQSTEKHLGTNDKEHSVSCINNAAS